MSEYNPGERTEPRNDGENIAHSNEIYLSSDDGTLDDFPDGSLKRDLKYFEINSKDVSYEDELFGPKNDDEYAEDKFPEGPNLSEKVAENMAAVTENGTLSPIGQVPTGRSNVNKTTRFPSKNSQRDDSQASEDDSNNSIFESVSVAYENRMKNLEIETQKLKEIDVKEFNYEEFEAIDENLMRELLELSINDRQPLHPTKCAPINTARDCSQRLQDSSRSIDTQQIYSSRQQKRHTSTNNLHTRSQRKLEHMLVKLDNRKIIDTKDTPGNVTMHDTQAKNELKRSKFFAGTRKISNPAKMEPNSNRTQNADRRLINSARSRSSTIINGTQRPAFRAGLLMDFSRKIDEDGRRAVAGKNNPYWRRRPSSSHKKSYVDEMLFGQTSRPSKSEPTWHAPWEEKSKQTKPYFCDWVWDRRKTPNKTYQHKHKIQAQNLLKDQNETFTT